MIGPIFGWCDVANVSTAAILFAVKAPTDACIQIVEAWADTDYDTRSYQLKIGLYIPTAQGAFTDPGGLGVLQAGDGSMTIPSTLKFIQTFTTTPTLPTNPMRPKIFPTANGWSFDPAIEGVIKLKAGEMIICKLMTAPAVAMNFNAGVGIVMI
jgi:hypothetical protein